VLLHRYRYLSYAVVQVVRQAPTFPLLRQQELSGELAQSSLVPFLILISLGKSDCQRSLVRERFQQSLGGAVELSFRAVGCEQYAKNLGPPAQWNADPAPDFVGPSPSLAPRLVVKRHRSRRAEDRSILPRDLARKPLGDWQPLGKQNGWRRAEACGPHQFAAFSQPHSCGRGSEQVSRLLGNKAKGVLDGRTQRKPLVDDRNRRQPASRLIHLAA
jgi:hypothetical protein